MGRKEKPSHRVKKQVDPAQKKKLVAQKIGNK